MSELLKKIQNEFKDRSTPGAKAAALKFVPGAQKVYGIRTPVLNELAKKYKEGGFFHLWRNYGMQEHSKKSFLPQKC